MPFCPFFCPYMNPQIDHEDEDDFRSPDGPQPPPFFGPGPGQGPGFGPPFGPGQGPGFGPPFGPGQGPGFGPPFGPGQGPGFGGQDGPPGPPPSITPSIQSATGAAPGGVGVLAVDPGAIRPCRYRFIYIWPRYGRPFWAWLTFVGPRSAAGFRWTGSRWRYFGIDLRQIQSFTCY